MNGRAIGAMARVTFLEAVRQKFFQFLVLVGLSVLLSSFLFRQFSFGTSELKFLLDLGFGATTFFGFLLAVVLSAQILYAEWENRTVFAILARPLARHDFLLGKFLGMFCLLTCFVLVMVVLLTLLVYFRESELVRNFPERFPDGSPLRYGDILAYGLIQLVKLGVVTAITFTVGAFSRSYLYTVVVSFLLVVIAQLQYIAAEAYGEEAPWLMRLFAGLITTLTPNFQVFNVSELMMYSESGVFPEFSLLRILGYGGVYGIVFLGAGVVFFRNRET